MKQRIVLPGMDVLRGVAALLVFLFHYWAFYAESLPDFFTVFSVGHVGVDLFFVLSGLLVTLSLWGSSSVTSYFSKRIRRIAPLAIGTGVIFWVITTDFSWDSVQDLIAHLLFIHGFFPQWYHSINPVMWSISIEMAFYVLLPLVWVVFSKKDMKQFLLIFSGLVVLSFLYRGGVFFFFEEWDWQQRVIFSEQLWGRLDQFFLGIVLACIALSESVQQQIQQYKMLFISFAGFFLTVSFFVFITLQSGFRELFFGQVFLHFITAGGFFFLLLWVLLHFKNNPYEKTSLPIESLSIQSVCFRKWREGLGKSFSFLGKISYGVYLFHYPVLSQVLKFVENPLLGFVMSAVLTGVLSWGSWEYFEKRFLVSRK